VKLLACVFGQDSASCCLTSEDLSLGQVVSRSHGRSGGLNEERAGWFVSRVSCPCHLMSGDLQYIKEHKNESKSPSFDTKDLRTDGEVVNHSSQDHIDVCINPQWCKLNNISLCRF